MIDPNSIGPALIRRHTDEILKLSEKWPDEPVLVFFHDAKLKSVGPFRASADELRQAACASPEIDERFEELFASLKQDADAVFAEEVEVVVVAFICLFTSPDESLLVQAGVMTYSDNKRKKTEEAISKINTGFIGEA
jgi:hypothetical protein